MAGSGPEMDPDPNPDPLARGADPDPYQSAKDLQHCYVLVLAVFKVSYYQNNTSAFVKNFIMKFVPVSTAPYCR